MRRPGTIAEYINLIEQAIFELEELRACDQWNHEDDEGELDFIDNLQNKLHILSEQLKTDQNFSPGNNLPWMNLVRANIRHIPFANLFDLINQTYRLGLEL